MSREPRIVAELGRPETPAETAARTAENSQNRRSRQTVNNLIYSLLATLGLVLVIVLIVPRATPTTHTNVDFAKIAAQGQGTEPDALASPKLPKGWTSNSAELRQKTASDVDEWYIGLITPSSQYIGFTQGFKANDTWVANEVANTSSDGTTTIDGVKWTIYNNRDSSAEVGSAKYALTTVAGDSTYVLLGTAKDAEFRTIAKALVPAITAAGDNR
jgi:hypothetical protein